MSTIDSANSPQEFPDIVGARPTNPLAANFKSFIPASAHLPELTWPHLVTGTILGIIFGASSLYLVLKLGLTVSASIPVAVLSITIFRVASKFLRTRDATILQHNIVQTAGSAGESIAFADETHTTANAEIVNQEAASGGGKVIFTGFGIGFLYQAAMGAFRMW